MTRVSVLVLERHERRLLQGLGLLGLMQMTPTDASDLPLTVRREEPAVERCGRLLGRVAELRKLLEIPVVPELTVPLQNPSLDEAEAKLCAMEARTHLLVESRRQLLRRLAELTAAEEQLAAYVNVDFPLDEPNSFSFLHFVTGTLPIGAVEKLQIGENAAVLALPEQGARQPLLALTTRDGRAALDTALQRAGFQRENLPTAASATPKMLSEDHHRQRTKLELELARLDDSSHALATELAAPLAGIEQQSNLERRLLEAAQNAAHTESAVLFSGWVASADAKRLGEYAREITGGCCAVEVIKTENFTDEEVPVLVQPPRWLRPFTRLVAAYGLPQYHELEPTLFVAVSFVLMFGMMFGDLGHGATFIAAGSWVLLARRWSKLRDIGVLLLACGFSSAIFGLIYGSCFGLPGFKRFALWHDPLENDPMGLMSIAIGIGVVMISLGMLLNIINRFRRGNSIGGWLDKFGVAGLVFYWGALALLTQLPAIKAAGLLLPFGILLLVVPVVGWALKEPLEAVIRQASQPVQLHHDWFTFGVESVIQIFETVLSLVANTLSFVRLAAYAMSHAALLFATFLMADMVRHLPSLGGILSVLVVILGNLVAIVLEGIIASVQSLRLEYYEFFSKFFSGRGQPFRPFRLHNNPAMNSPF